MPTRPAIVAYVVQQLGTGVTSRRMFGEYGVYKDDTFIGVVCDERLFLKPTPGVRAALGPCEEAPPYPGAKPALVVAEDVWDDRQLMRRLAEAAAMELQKPTAKKAAGKRGAALKKARARKS